MKRFLMCAAFVAALATFTTVSAQTAPAKKAPQKEQCDKACKKADAKCCKADAKCCKAGAKCCKKGAKCCKGKKECKCTKCDPKTCKCGAKNCNAAQVSPKAPAKGQPAPQGNKNKMPKNAPKVSK
jgi:hypothetical protein